VFRVGEENTDSKYIVITTPVGCAHGPSISIGTLSKFMFKLIVMFAANLRSNVNLGCFLPIRAPFHFYQTPRKKITQPTFMGLVLIQ
jgi:hypothetical protein